jgi:chromosome segregation ATPase
MQRLSSAAAWVSVWFSGNKTQQRKYQQSLTHRRRLQSEIDELQMQFTEKVADVSRLTSIVADLTQEAVVRQREIEGLQHQVDIDKKDIEGMVRVNANLMTHVDKLIAQNVAESNRATTGERPQTEDII